MSYIRIFMPMTSEASGYGFRGRRPAGRSIVEGHSHNCKLTVWAQDLGSETRYDIFLLFADGGRYAGIGMGALPVDEKGKGEIRKEFNHEELGGFDLADIVAVAVIAKDAAGVVSPLCGYNGDTVAWRHSFYEYVRAAAPRHENAPPAVQPESEELENALQAEEVPDMDRHPGEDIPEDDKDAGESIPETDRNAQEDTPTPPPPEASPPDDSTSWSIPMPARPTPIMPAPAPPPQGEIAKSFRIALDQLHADTIQRSTPHSQHRSTLEEIIASKEPITPFKKQNRNTHWVSFDLSDRVPPPINKPNLFNEPFIQEALENHGHLILGMIVDQGPGRYVIGVPHNLANETRQMARKLGFTQYKRWDNPPPGKNNIGYWLMFIVT